jgi:hypothetical protein
VVDVPVGLVELDAELDGAEGEGVVLGEPDVAFGVPELPHPASVRATAEETTRARHAPRDRKIIAGV